MGQKTHNTPGEFAMDLQRYLGHVLNTLGREDLSGRFMAEITGDSRSRNYWAKIIKGEQAMTANDVQEVASAFGVSPFEWVANARRHRDGKSTMPLSVNVGGVGHDAHHSPLSPAASMPERAVAKKGVLKNDQ